MAANDVTMVCERCGTRGPTHTVETVDGTTPTELCERCIGIVVNPRSHFRVRVPKRAYSDERVEQLRSLLGEVGSYLVSIPDEASALDKTYRSALQKRIADVLKEA